MMQKQHKDQPPENSATRDVPPAPCQTDGVLRCPVCGGAGQERKQKWFCRQCGQLIMTCCD